MHVLLDPEHRRTTVDTDVYFLLFPLARTLACVSLRIFLSRIITSDSMAANPALKIVTDSHADVARGASISITYKDGKTLDLKTDDMKVNDVLRQVGKHARKLQEKEDATS